MIRFGIRCSLLLVFKETIFIFLLDLCEVTGCSLARAVRLGFGGTSLLSGWLGLGHRQGLLVGRHEGDVGGSGIGLQEVRAKNYEAFDNLLVRQDRLSILIKFDKELSR